MAELPFKKQKIKEEQEAAKEERKRKREENKKAKVGKPKKVKASCSKQVNEEYSSDTSVEVCLESEGEGDNWMGDEDDQENFPDLSPTISPDVSIMSSLKTGDHVIVKYNDRYFPGKVKAIQEKRSLVSVMSIAGLNSWKWPYPVDEIWYSEDEVIEKILEPIPVNKRGHFKVKEIQKYCDFFQM